MEPKPAFLGPQTASAFQDPSVIAAYPRRAPYPETLFQLLAELIAGSSHAVLDVGTGPGDIARRLAPYVERVDAVDWSAGMIALGKQLPGGDDPRIRWIVGRVEEATLEAPYGLIAAGESLHWMDWDTVLPRFAAALEPGGFLAIVNRTEREVPWVMKNRVRCALRREIRKNQGLMAAPSSRLRRLTIRVVSRIVAMGSGMLHRLSTINWADPANTNPLISATSRRLSCACCANTPNTRP
jgi:trans-aconitate methyltransferase